ncbi:methyltransferase [Ligilactobacillus pabuli]|uniref:Methyltransferase n=1 Tax=Ligilactobacillus pabuli TaxID=2886039 RepID=A0ABQ5JFC4_9LACO|nr:site-specific DNA-methyltransferase [Ligilactobacillus pabuli]GKS80720.1 methyltransferase [Ligilactobacillus pabuli]
MHNRITVTENIYRQPLLVVFFIAVRKDDNMIDLKQGDCLELMKEIPDKSVDMVLCDLPYGTTKCRWDNVLPFDKLWEQYHRIIKDKGAIVLFATEPFTSTMICSNIKEFREKITWIKHRASNWANAKRRHLKYTEDIIIFGSGQPTYNRQMEPRKSRRVAEAQKNNWTMTNNNTSQVSFSPKQTKNVSSLNWDKDYKNPMDYIKCPSVVNNSHEKVNHPTQKPVKLLTNLIKTYTHEGELVLDNTMGSGSTGVACVNTKRDFIGMELDEEYFHIAEKRIQEAQSEIRLDV